MKKLSGVVVLGLVVLLVVVLVRATRLPSLQMTGVEPVRVEVDGRAAAERFAESLTFATISPQDPAERDSAAFLALHEFFEQTYPLVHEHLGRETVSELSLLYTWEGSDPDLEPIVLMGHLDVVPVIPGTEDDWTHPPFGGVIADGYVWGRGAIDDKSSVVSVLEAVEGLLAQGHRPARTFYLAFGHDEEVGGPEGAGEIAELLEARGVADLAFVLDEGGAIADGLVPGIDGPAAIVGIGEKGFLSLELSISGAGGHSSMPPASTNVGILARAITRLEQDPFPLRLTDPVAQQFSYLGPEMGFGARAVVSNLWLFKPLFLRLLSRSPQGAAMLRTTTAATMFDAGVKDNVLPISATAVVNFRILPGETVESVTERVREVIDDDRVQIRDVSSSRDPSPVSDPTGPAYLLLERTIREAAGVADLIVAPYLVMGGTDAKYYAGRSRNVFRFLPARLGEGDMDRFHGTNERLAVESLAGSIAFFQRLIRASDEL
jgi:carboxypeptidase PM20D1